MGINYLIGQLFGILAIVFLSLSLKVNRKKYVLRCQAVSNFGYAMEYLLLGGLTGSLLSFMCIVRNLIFQKFPNGKVPLIWLLITELVMIMLTIVTFKGVYSLLPALAITINSYGLWQKNMTTHRIIGVIASLLMIAFDIHLLGISVIATSLEMIFYIMAIVRFDLKKKKKA